MKIRNSKFEIRNCQKGVSLYLAILIMVVLLALSLGISAILYGQMKMMRRMDHSVIAFYAADTGIEAILMYRDDPSNSPPASCTKTSPCSLGEAKYYLDIRAGGQGDCPSELEGRPINYCIKSIGLYRDVRRAIEITY